MRIALITLAVAALAFIGSIIYMFAQKNGGLTLPTNSNTAISSDSLAIETLKYQIKNEQALSELTEKVNKLSGQTPTISTLSASGSVSSGSTNTGNIVPISAKFLAKVLPIMTLSLTENTGIFDLHIFDLNTRYSTYTDPKFGATVIASLTPYDTFLKNFRALDKSIYTINETKTFPFRSFYVNTPKTDTNVRIVMEVESETLLITLPKSKFTQFKAAILK